MHEKNGTMVSRKPGSGDALRDSGKDKRGTTRIPAKLPITVISVDALGERFREQTATTSVSCHGCKYRTTHFVSKGSAVTLEIYAPNHSLLLHRVMARVAWVQRPPHFKEAFEIGLAFTEPQNVWQVPEPPEDWLPYATNLTISDSTEAILTDSCESADASKPLASVTESRQEEFPERIELAAAEQQPSDPDLQRALADAVKNSFEQSFVPAMSTTLQRLAEPFAAVIAEKVWRELSFKLNHIAEQVGEEGHRHGSK